MALAFASLAMLVDPAVLEARGARPASAVRGKQGSPAEIIALTNTERKRRGLPSLSVDRSCQAAIRAHVADLARSGSLSHSGSNGSGPDERYRRHGGGRGGVGENVAYNATGTAQSFVSQWMNSSGHRDNILNPTYRAMGAAVAASCDRSERRCAYYAGQCYSR